MHLAAGPQRVDPAAHAAGVDCSLAEMNVPGPVARPTDRLSGLDGLADPNARVDVLVTEVGDVHETADAGAARRLDSTSLDRVHPVRPAGGCAGLGPGVPGGGVDAVLEGGAALPVRPRVEEGAAHRMLLVVGLNRPPAPVVVVVLDHLGVAGHAPEPSQAYARLDCLRRGTEAFRTASGP